MDDEMDPIAYVRRGGDPEAVDFFACARCGNAYSTSVYRGERAAVIAAARAAARDCVMCRSDSMPPEDALRQADERRTDRRGKAEEVFDLGECFSDTGDAFYMDVSEAAEAGETGVYAARFEPFKIDIGSVLEMAIDDHHEDASTDDLAGVDDLSQAIDRFNQAQTRGSYTMDQTRWQRIPQRQTFGMIKPDATARGLEYRMMEHISKAGFRIVETRRLTLARSDAEWLYREHAARDHFADLVDYTISGDVVLMLIEGADDDVATAFRRLMGATDHTKAEPGTLRAEFAVGYRENSIHGSDSVAAAKDEIAHFMS